MAEQITIELPAVTPERAALLAGRMAEIGARIRLGLLAPGDAPVGAVNPCQYEGCDFLGEYESGGERWLLYECEGVLRSYKA
ncbi:MAG: hypothetical protein H6838_12850 [Planctomycetes bacterium]|nr:hypothetical protein [Planctomycetota bacterium]